VSGVMIPSLRTDWNTAIAKWPVGPERATLDGMRRKAAKKNPHAAALGRLGGLKGGRARASALTAAQRRLIARKAARARWKKRKR
jgi:hypothetical protein